MSKRPWYQWFPGDYLQDTVHLSLEADLLYRRLLDIHWRDGFIPVNPDEIRRLSRFPEDWFERAWPEVKLFFQVRGGRKSALTNKRLDGQLRSLKRIATRSAESQKARRNKELGQPYVYARARGGADPDPDPDPEEEKEKENNPPIKPPLKENVKNPDTAKAGRARFQRPELREVIAYCDERQNSVDPLAWYYHYESNGWKVGRNGMRDWKAAVRTWERNAKANGNDRPRTKDDYTRRARERMERVEATEVLDGDDFVVRPALVDGTRREDG